MAGRDRMTIEEVVRQVLRDEHADVIRESVKAVAPRSRPDPERRCLGHLPSR